MYFLLNLNEISIFEQLQLEEALLRADNGHWCLINSGAPDAIVVGISGKPEQLLNLEAVSRANVPVIRRYSGGGTVYVDPDTIFITFIGEGQQFPRPLLEQAERLLAPLFPPGFALRENDYVIGDLKIGGNAQYLTKGRWMHHISFLWDFDEAKMEMLRLPDKRPHYRGDRSHGRFLTKLSNYFPSKAAWIAQCQAHLMEHLAGMVTTCDIKELCSRPHRRGTTNIVLDRLEPVPNNCDI